MDTRKFKTRSEIVDYKLPRIKGNNQHQGKTIIALDGGYSSVNGACPLRVFTFPSFAKKAPADLEVVGKLRENDILLRDNANGGQVWVVGQAAETLMDQSDLDSVTDASLYTRYRYDSEMYKVIMTTGIVLGLWGTPEGSEIYIQTGLPSAYKDRDSGKLIKALSGHYDVSIRIHQSSWKNFKFDIPEDHVFVMEQPQGTLCAVALSPDGKSEYRDIMSATALIDDAGFGTEDFFSIKKGFRDSHQTYNDTAMKSVFEAVIADVSKSNPGAELKVFEFQKYLEDGRVSYFDQDEFKMRFVDFADILERCNTELAEKSIKRTMQDYQNLQHYEYLVVTGGTGESRFDYIKNRLSGIPSLKVVPGNVNFPDLPCVYANVMGYYLFRHSLIEKAVLNEQEG